MNVELLERVKQHFFEEPRRANMNYWLLQVNPSEKFSPPCGTVGCIAGITVLLANENLNVLSPWSTAPAIHAHKLLDLPNYKLFYVSDWPSDLRKKLHAYPTQSAEYAGVICAAIDNYVATDGWPGV